jgi:hypothetical protein
MRVEVQHLSDCRDRADVDRFLELLACLAGGLRLRLPPEGWDEERIAEDRTTLLRVLVAAHRRRHSVVAFPSPRPR